MNFHKCTLLIFVSSISVKGNSIFIGNLPNSATPGELREIFEKFGPIKLDGVQVRSQKVCFQVHFCCCLLILFVSSRDELFSYSKREIVLALWNLNLLAQCRVCSRYVLSSAIEIFAIPGDFMSMPSVVVFPCHYLIFVQPLIDFVFPLVYLQLLKLFGHVNLLYDYSFQLSSSIYF